MPDMLYVVCHGLISLIRRKDESITALMIRMDNHRYLAGTWLNELDIAEGEFELRNVSDNSAGIPQGRIGRSFLDPARNLILKVASVPRAGAGSDVHTAIHLPRPLAVYSYYKTSVEGLLSGDAAPSVRTTLSGVQVLGYAVDEGKRPEIVGHGWEGVPGRTSDPAIFVLHLYNEPAESFLIRPFAEQEQHNLDEFNRCSTVLGADLRLERQAAGLPDEGDKPPTGLLSLELQPLAYREEVVRKVAEAMISLDGEPTSTNPATCNGANGDEAGG